VWEIISRVMRTGYPQVEETGLAITAHLALCAFVCGLFGFAFCELMQPKRIPNLGLAAYRPLPGTVIIYPQTVPLPHGPPVTPVAPADLTSEEPPEMSVEEPPKRTVQAIRVGTSAPETTGRAIVAVHSAPHPSRRDAKRTIFRETARSSTVLTRPQQSSAHAEQASGAYVGNAAVD
jgi:hypothetical protein